MAHNVVGARELKTRLGTYLRRVREGSTLLITDRGEAVAELRPITESADEETTLSRLSRVGAITLPRRKTLQPFRPVRVKGKPLSRTVIEDREDRF